MRLRILVVDDTEASRNSIAQYLTEAGHQAEPHATPFTALEALDGGPWDLVLTDLRMPSMDGIQFLREIKTRNPGIAVILMTAHGTVETAVEAIRMGALDYLEKPFHLTQLGMHIGRLEELLTNRQELADLRKTLGPGSGSEGLVGNSPEMQSILQQIEQFADRPANVLVTGETGTGKEMVARALHNRSRRKGGPFTPVACAAVPRELAESELFGHESGAFTGAVKRRHGQIEMSSGGTLFLDDVDDLPPDIQPKLLRAIQEQEFQRVGGERLLKADLRIISSTKRDLETLAREGRFRQDLLYRLQVLRIFLPPLRERRSDILVLARHFLGVHAREANEPPKALAEEAERKLLAHDWPGNVRELRHATEYALAVSTKPVIQAVDLPLRDSAPATPGKLFTLNANGAEQLDLRALQMEIERDAFLWALKKSQGDQGRAAALLKMPRTTFLYRLRQLNA